VYRIRFWSSICPDIRKFFGFALDWISFFIQPVPEPDYPNKINCGHAKKLIWNYSCIRKNYDISKSYYEQCVLVALG